jgi:DNA-binding response OmpR family regulator
VAVRVLIVEDDQSVLTFVERVLRDAGYETMTAADGMAARDLVVEAGVPDLVLTDKSMPRMSGSDLARSLRERHPDLKVLYLTGYVDPVEETRGELWEKDGYLEKPCTVRGLLQAVSLLLFRRLSPPPTFRQSRAL